MPRRASASTARPAAAAAATATASSSSSTTTTIVANSTAAEEGSAAAAGPSSKTLLVSVSQAGFSAASASASASASKSGDGTQASSASRPRRIMPSRSRRGGPGVGISDVDTHILETLRRRRENEPLIPAHAQFLLTTNSTRVRAFGESSKGAVDGEGSSQLNTCAYERYFDQPEVIHAYREQQLIQTPEFTLLPEHGAVGGRFRPRSLDDEGIDTSDAAYEKRHRKYESFEKRQRLREKEKLKHEHYKLKERIEQLRVLEPSTFLSAPEPFFAGSSRSPLHQGHDAQGSTADVPVPLHNEGEWRKRQMLDVANSLDARYRTLLDTAPSRAPDLSTQTPPPPAAPAALSQTTPIPTSPPGHTPDHVPITTVRRTPSPAPGPARTTSPTVLRPQRAPSLSLPLTEVIELDSDGEEKTPELVKVETTNTQPILSRNDTTQSLKLRIKFPGRPPPPVSSISTPLPSSRSPSSPRLTEARIMSSSPNPKASTSTSSSPTRPRPKPIFKNPSAPSQYVRVPFVKRIEPQDVLAAAAIDDATPPTPSTLSTQQSTTPALSSNSAIHITLRRRPGRTTVHPYSGSPAATTSGATTSGPKQQTLTVHGLGHGTSRVRKRRRVELSDEDEEYPKFDTDDGDDEAIDGAVEDARHEDGREEEDEAEEDSGEEGRQRARWRESALYREAQRHAGAPSGRKTHRHLGIFGLKGFPAEVEHLHEFEIPQWVLPRGDPRVEREQREVQDRRVGTARGSEKVRRGSGGGGDCAGVGQRRLRDAVAALAVGEEPSCSKSDRVETASAVDSQMTEELIIS